MIIGKKNLYAKTYYISRVYDYCMDSFSDDGRFRIWMQPWLMPVEMVADGADILT